MSSSEFESGIPILHQGLSIPELVRFIKHSFLELEFNEVQTILMDREKKLKTEIENLRRDRDSIKEEVCLLERSHGLAELEKLKLEEQLERCGRQCEELKETIKMLTLEQRSFYDRLKREKDCNYDDNYEEKSKMASGKNESIIELNEKINELKNQNSESEELVRSYQEKLKCMDMKLVEMEQVITDLRHEKLLMNESVEELRQRQIESDEVVEELRCKNAKAAKLLDELRAEKMKSDKMLRQIESDSIKEETCLLERSRGLHELEKLKLEEKLERCGRQCEELKETIKMLTSEQKPFHDRLKSEKDCYNDNDYEEKSKMASGKNESIIELNKKINELKNQKLESEELVRSYQEKLKCMDMKLVEMEQVITDLRREKLVVNESMEELRQRQIESDEVVEELRRKNVEAAKLLEEKMKSDKGSECHEGWYLKLEGKVMEMEGMLANMLKVKLEDLADVVNTIENSAPSAQGRNVELPDCFRGGSDSVENDKVNADAEDVVLSPRVCFATNSTRTGGIGLPKKGGTNMVQSWRNEDNTNKGEEPRFSDIIEIFDSDDETNTGCGELITKKRKRSMVKSDDVDSTDSECSEAHIEHLLASIGAK